MLISKLFAQLWSDESGAVLSTEYIMLGSIVAAGGSAGMVALRDSMVAECKDFGTGLREMRQSYMPPVGKPNGTAGQGQVGQLPYYGMPGTTAPLNVDSTRMSP